MEHEELEKVNLSDGEIAKFYRHVLLRFENHIKDIENEEENKRKMNPVSLLEREESKNIENNYKIKIISSYSPFEENEPHEADTIKIYFTKGLNGIQP